MANGRWSMDVGQYEEGMKGDLMLLAMFTRIAAVRGASPWSSKMRFTQRDRS
jgi:hypothetical protein